MKRFSTQCMKEIEHTSERGWRDEVNKPRKHTLDFLTQLARVYHSESMLQPELCAFTVN